MYKCYSLKHFFSLLLLDAIIFGMIYIFFGIGKFLFFTSAEYADFTNATDTSWAVSGPEQAVR